jgi:putative addiction module component (TIGR02574 family)
MISHIPGAGGQSEPFRFILKPVKLNHQGGAPTVSINSRQIFSNALRMQPIERAELIEKLFSSFEFPSRKKIDALWAREAENRLDAFETGKLKSISAREVFKRIIKRSR